MYMILQGDARRELREMQEESFQTCVTSPPYWGLRDYKLEPLVWNAGGMEGCEYTCEHEWGDEQIARGPAQEQAATSQRRGRSNTDEQKHRGVSQGSWCRLCGAWRGSLGQEPTPELYVQHLVEIFREVRRVLRADGTLWLNLGDSYQGGNRGAFGSTRGGKSGVQQSNPGSDTFAAPNRFPIPGLKPKDLIGVPWRMAFALQADGWYLRSDIIWHKPNPMPESVTDRPTKAHEYIFLLSKSAKYYYDADAIREPVKPDPRDALWGKTTQTSRHDHAHDAEQGMMQTRGAHFATFPPALIEPCVLAGCPKGGVVLDPFAGAGTTMLVAERLGRDSVGIELSAGYVEMAEKRLKEALV